MLAMTEQVTEYRLNEHGTRIGKLENAMESIATSLKTLTELEVHHAETREALERAFKGIGENRTLILASCEKMEIRVRAIENQMPILKLTSKWIISGALAVIGAAISSIGLLAWAIFTDHLNG